MRIADHIKSATKRFSLNKDAVVSIVLVEAANVCLAGRLLFDEMSWHTKLPKRLVLDCATGWNSTYYMLERLVSLRWEVGAVLSESGGDSSLDLQP